MRKEIILKEEHLKLIPYLRIESANDTDITVSTIFSICGGALLDDLSLIFGLRDKAIQNSEDSINGRSFPNDVEEYMLNAYNYVKDNFLDIEKLLHEYGSQHGLQIGTYIYNDETCQWIKKE